MALRRINVLVVGECGNGKSTLINALRDPAATARPEIGKTPTGVTKQIKVYPCKATVDGVQIYLFDTPGVGDHDVKPMGLIGLIDAALSGAAAVEGGLQGIIVTTPIPDARIRLGAQIVQILVDKGFVDSKAMWQNVILVGTKMDKAEPDDIRVFMEGLDGKESVRELFFKSAGGQAGATVMVSVGRYEPLLEALLRLPAATLTYQEPSIEVMSAALAGRLGIDRAEFETEMQAVREAVKAQAQQVFEMHQQMLQEKQRQQEEDTHISQQVQMQLRLIQEEAAAKELTLQQQMQALQQAQQAQSKELRQAAQVAADHFGQMLEASNQRADQLTQKLEEARIHMARTRERHSKDMRRMARSNAEFLAAMATSSSEDRGSSGWDMVGSIVSLVSPFVLAML